MLPEDPTLDELRLALAPAVAEAAVFDGWTLVAVENALKTAGQKAEIAPLLYPDGAMDMIAAWTASVDAAMAEALPASELARLPIRERISRLVQFRLDAAGKQQEALRRALSIMAMPQNAPRALQLGWRSADVMWRLAGDKATDWNHYSKRTILSGIYAATLTVLAHDESENHVDTMAFLTRRIDGVMRFEKAKAKWLTPAEYRFSPSRFLGRLRYPAR